MSALKGLVIIKKERKNKKTIKRTKTTKIKKR
jgi:hypothetical protein